VNTKVNGYTTRSVVCPTYGLLCSLASVVRWANGECCCGVASCQSWSRMTLPPWKQRIWSIHRLAVGVNWPENSLYSLYSTPWAELAMPRCVTCIVALANPRTLQRREARVGSTPTSGIPLRRHPPGRQRSLFSLVVGQERVSCPVAAPPLGMRHAHALRDSGQAGRAAPAGLTGRQVYSPPASSSRRGRRQEGGSACGKRAGERAAQKGPRHRSEGDGR
jgi:hypothetical protein